MTPRRYIDERAREGVSTTQAAQELATITGATERAAWKWVRADKFSPAAARCLHLWALLPQELREAERVAK